MEFYPFLFFIQIDRTSKGFNKKMLFWISAVIRAAPYALASLVYLRKLLDPPSPNTVPVGAPYEPPFRGGQCRTVYIVDWRFFDGDILVGGGQNGARITGAIRGFEYRLQSGTLNSWLVYNNGNTEFNAGNARGNGNTTLRAKIINLRREDGQPDNCGDIPNPNPTPAPPINADGIAESPPPNILNNSTTVNVGSSLSPQLAIGGAISSIRGAISAAVAAANAAANTLGAIASVANAVGAIGDAIAEIAKVLDKLEDRERDKEKENEDKKDTLRYEFGSISKDGFLRLYPDVNTQKYKAEQLDLIIQSIPIGYGKYFGNKSPNFYRFKSLGYIAFVSPTFGVIEYKEIEFSRVSFIIPDDAIGFFYHLGLDGSIAANSFAFYTKGKV